MLVLTRKTDEAIFIGEQAEIKVHVLGIQGHHIKLGIEAPKKIPVHREEVYLRAKNQNEDE